MKKSVFLSLIAGALALVACSQAKQAPEVPETPEVPSEPSLELVASPDFVFTSMGKTLFSTFPTTRAEASTDEEEKTYVPGVEVNLSVCTAANQYLASKLSVHIRTGNDVTVLVPVAASAFSENDDNSLALILNNPSGNGKYGETEQTLKVDGNTVKALVEYLAEGIKVTVTGVNQAVVDYLVKEYGDGLTVEVWNYFNDTATIESLKAGFNAGATVSFSEKPEMYVNAFAKVPNYIEALGGSVEDLPRIYSKEVNDFLYPYLDEAFTQALDAQYWVRPAEGEGEDVHPSKYYLLRGHKNENDCTVVPVGVTFAQKQTNNADIPADVETKYYDIPANYNVIYF